MLAQCALSARFWSIRFSIKSSATTDLAAAASGPVNLRQVASDDASARVARARDGVHAARKRCPQTAASQPVAGRGASASAPADAGAQLHHPQAVHRTQQLEHLRAVR